MNLFDDYMNSPEFAHNMQQLDEERERLDNLPRAEIAQLTALHIRYAYSYGAGVEQAIARDIYDTVRQLSLLSITDMIRSESFLATVVVISERYQLSEDQAERVFMWLHSWVSKGLS